MEKEEFLAVYRHSLAHILAKAVIELFGKENVQYAIGPQIENGLYYDFVLPRTLNNDDYKTIEDKMHEIIKRREPWTRKVVSKAEALDIFKDQKFKTELIEELPEDETITLYYTGDDYVDLCRGPHVDNSQELMNVAFEVRSISGAYWRGDENRDQLQRIYVTAFPDKQQLKEYKKLLREAAERDHKKLGPQLELFMFDESAPGMPYWLPRGWKMFNALLNFWRGIHEEHGYQEISGPVLSNSKLWQTSGHWGHYKDNMFIIPGAKEDESDYYACKPMNCPNAILVYKKHLRSYRDLPFRINQVDVIHRKEKSGELNGLFRVQMFRQDDAHILVAEEQIASEIKDIMSIATQIYGTFGLTYKAELSTRPDDYMGDIKVWDKAEKDLKDILDDVYGPGNYEVNEGDGAFYGPKIDFHLEDCIGRTWQCGTIQLDMNLPERFDLTYTGPDGEKHRPVMIHRVVFGSIERFIGILTEHFAGAFPLWLSPVQAKIMTITDRADDAARALQQKLEKAGVRTEIDLRNEKIGFKIREARNMKIPYLLVLGDREAQEGTVSVTLRGGHDLGSMPVDALIARMRQEIETKAR